MACKKHKTRGDSLRPIGMGLLEEVKSLVNGLATSWVERDLHHMTGCDFPRDFNDLEAERLTRVEYV